jgi:hypothetical protein
VAEAAGWHTDAIISAVAADPGKLQPVREYLETKLADHATDVDSGNDDTGGIPPATLATAWAAIGQPTHAQEVIAHHGQSGTDEWDNAKVALVSALTETGDLDHAERTASTIVAPRRRTPAMARIAAAAIRNGELSRVNRLVRHLADTDTEDDDDRGQLLAALGDLGDLGDRCTLVAAPLLLGDAWLAGLVLLCRSSPATASTLTAELER